MVAALALLVAASADPFFDGQSTAGWRGNPKLWKVDAGAIVGSSHPDGIKGNTFLLSEKKYRDFELAFKVRLRGGDSGVQIRSTVSDPANFVVIGPQANIAPGHWGNLWGEKFGKDGKHYMMQAFDQSKLEPSLKKDDFNDYSIRAVGKKVTIKLNGVTTVDRDFDELPPEGVIAFQLHGGKPMEVTFRDIRFTELK